MFRKRVRVLLPLLVLLSFLLSCATNPVTGRRELSLVSGAQEEQIGREGYPAVVREFGLYSEAQLQSYVETVGQKIARVSHLPNLQWKFTLVDDPAVNAFAMPGGYIYVTRGILAHLNSEAQLAGVLGHEVGHVTARHTAQRLTQQSLAGLGLGLVGIVAPGFERYSQAAQMGLQLMFLKYGRDDENQADELGIQYATAAGYDPREIPPTYAMLKRVGEQAGQRLPEFLSTHPDPGNREERTRGLAQQAVAGKSGLAVGGKDFLMRQEGLVFGRDPREGYFEGNHYYHPGMRFQITFPSGWKYQDSKSAVMAANSSQTAILQLGLAAQTNLSPSAYVADLERSGKIGASRGSNENIGGFPAWVGRISVADAQGQPMTLVAAWIRKSPEMMFEILGRAAQAGDEEPIVSTARSFRSLNDAARLNVTPDRLKVVTLTRSGDFGTVIPTLGTQAAQLDVTALINNRFPDQPVRSGELIKIVVPGRK